MSTEFVVLLLISFIYIFALVAFNKARAKFTGGKIGELINLVIITVILVFIADYILLFKQFIPTDIIFIVQTLFRTAGLSCLAFGGIKIAN